jgi:hypothetical protein
MIQSRKGNSMGALETLVQAVQASEKLDAGRKEMAVAFLRAVGPTVEGLGAEALKAVMEAAAEGTDVAAAVAENLDAPGVAALLALTETDMAALADRRAAEAQAARAALQTLEEAALAVVAKVVIGVL